MERTNFIRENVKYKTTQILLKYNFGSLMEFVNDYFHYRFILI